MIQGLIDDGLVDYIAMDIKTDPHQYVPFIARECDPDMIISSICLIMASPVPYEFKTTCVKPFIDEPVMETITGLIEGATRYALQRFQGKKVLHPEFFKEEGARISEEEFKRLIPIAENRVKECVVR